MAITFPTSSNQLVNTLQQQVLPSNGGLKVSQPITGGRAVASQVQIGGGRVLATGVEIRTSAGAAVLQTDELPINIAANATFTADFDLRLS